MVTHPAVRGVPINSGFKTSVTLGAALMAFVLVSDAVYAQGCSLPAQPKEQKTVLLKSGDLAPDFTLSSISGEKIFLEQYHGNKNVVFLFIPAA